MNILILHPNFPGQFKNIAIRLVNEGHKVKFLCQTHYGRRINGVERLCMKGTIGDKALIMKQTTQLEQVVERGGQYRSAFLKIKSSGWTPEVIISHTSFGCGMFAKEIWPKAKLVGYLEWWFNPASSFFTYDETNVDLNLNATKTEKYWLRNQTISLELASADEIIAPTKWQRNQLPINFKNKCKVIFDGIDTEKIRYHREFRSKQPLVTYGTRGMEPMRGFPQFIKCIPELIKENKHLQIEIAGEDQISYGGKLPKQGTWGKWAKKYLEKNNVSNNVKWRGYLKNNEYINWLSSSWCHVYLTHPFVTSWSLVENIFMGLTMVASNVEPVKEFAAYNKNVVLVDHRQNENLVSSIMRQVSDAAGQKKDCHIEEFHQIVDSRHCTDQWMSVLGLDLTTGA